MLPVDVFLIRGLARESGHWGSFVPLLESQNFVSKVHCLDLLGAGPFTKMTSPLTIGENAEFLLSQMPTGGKRPRVIFSVSLGSMVAIEMCQRKPDVCSQLFVMNTSFKNLSPLHHRLQLAAIKRFFKIGRAKSNLEREKQVLKMVSNNQEVHDEVAELWDQVSLDRPMRLQNFFRQLVAASLYRLADTPPTTPIVVLNSRGDRMVDPSCSEKLAELWNLPLLTHPSAGHDICIDDPQWVIDAMTKILSS